MKRLILPLFLLAATVALRLLTPSFTETVQSVIGISDVDLDRTILTLLWLAGGFVAVRAADVLVWRGWFATRTKHEPPKLLRTVVGVTLWGFVLLGIVSVVFGQSITGLLTASSVVLAVVGFAMRSLIADLFYGIALAAERPFEVGHWIRIDGNGEDKNVEGKVVEMNWRATRLLTEEKISVVVPNGVLAGSQFENFSHPQPYFRASFSVRLAYEVTSYQAERVLLSAVKQVPETASIPEMPTVQIADFHPDGVEWEARFWVPDREILPDVTYKVRRIFLRNLYFAGIEVARDRSEILFESMTRKQRNAGITARNWLARIDLFSHLGEEELYELAEVAHPVLSQVGTPIVRQGDEGESLFVLLEGALQVSVEGDAGKEHVVGFLEPGKFFGEMSLLTGSPRGATVTPVIDSQVYEITRSDLAPIMERRPELAEVMSAFLAARQTAAESRLAEMADREAAAAEQQTLADQFLGKIRGFFDTGFLKSLTQQHKREIREVADAPFLRAAMAASALVTLADKIIADEERLEVEGLFTSLDMFMGLDRDEGLALFNQHLDNLSAGMDGAEDSAMDDIRVMSAHPEAARLIVRICLGIGEADGRVVEPERRTIRNICKAMDIPPGEFGLDH